MKLIRFGAFGEEKPGIELDGKKYDVSHLVADYDEDFFANDGLKKLEEIASNDLPEIPADARLGAPVKRPGKIICIGLNYRKHAAESGMEVPKEPVVFFKATSSIVGPNDQVIIPKNSEKTDWEVELGVVIGKRANYVSKEEALDYVAGYVVHNDVSERAFQLERGGQWVKGKSADTFAPLGPYLVTKDEVADPNNLNLWLKLNGEKVQDGNTNDFIFNVQEVIAHLSEFMSLMPGDIISTGTPEGVGFGFKPPKYLKEGDVIELGIEGLGEARQEVVAYKG
ncbi:fumarylacetoacetate hydrolase family protein [Marinoscillum furvescens]|uniref:2-keto-4-pentenoate hydratase/2-oxohepta-3-ene-1,7-dioic acid hydratase in catechol pathway n=1 Tax=Marinoscillum furvescens DSM 4134 TaxID=1122208 RepID=A0A3D9L6N5_MARFU|nr:fumarylacetoacetate hydrolase family protein [Marinoscillum furvescens]REE02008.1 2-keto-4-pentenoate hydratase/2-oxohepta-3-ene-1,7-dioic acid hydratase in catechol pathway [Marinoscillum furvescens DSM 4134]